MVQLRNLLFYQVAEKKIIVSVYFDKGSFWLTQKSHGHPIWCKSAGH